MSTTATKPRTTEFGTAYSAGITSLTVAAKIYLEDITADPGNVEVYAKAFPQIADWKMFRKLAQGVIIPELIFYRGPGPRKLASMSAAEQRKYIDKAVMLYNRDTGRTVRVPIIQMSGYQANQAFVRGTIRTVAQQKTYLAAIRNRKVERDAAYYEKVTDGIPKAILTTIVKKVFSKAEVEAIAESMDDDADDET